MDSFNRFLFETYKEFNLYLDTIIKQQSNSNNKKDDNSTTKSNGDTKKPIDFLQVGRDLVEECKDNADDDDLTNQYSEFIMCLCFFSGNRSVWKPLIEENVKLFSNQKTVNKNFNTGIPFCFAIPFGSRELLEICVSNGMDISLSLDNSYIMTTALYGNLEAFEFFIERDNVLLNHRNSNGDTAILFAAMNGENILIEKLVKSGENILAFNNHGFNVIICAAFHNQYETIEVLCNIIEEMYGKTKVKEMVDYKNKDGETALHIAARLGFHNTVSVLTKRGCSINLPNKINQTAHESAKRTLVLIKKDSSLVSSYEPQQKKMERYRAELDTLEHIQPLLSEEFKTRLFSKPNLVSTVKKSVKSYQKVLQIFDDLIKQKEIENASAFQSLLSSSSKKKDKKKSSNNNNNNDKNNDKKKQQQSSKSTTNKSNNNNQCTKNNKSTTVKTTLTPITTASTTTNPIIKSNNQSQSTTTTPIINHECKIEKEIVENLKEIEKEKDKQVENDKKIDNNNITTTIPIDYKQKYETLATMYLEQSKVLKETLSSLDEIESNFMRFKKSLYKRNEKAEALGLGIQEILGIGLGYLSMEQLTVLADIHYDSVNNIQLIKSLIINGAFNPGDGVPIGFDNTFNDDDDDDEQDD